MTSFQIRPKVLEFSDVATFLNHLEIHVDDLIITNRFIYEPFLAPYGISCQLLFLEDFGTQEPTDEVLEAVQSALPDEFSRIIAIGGGSIIDTAKLMSLTFQGSIEDLMEQRIPFQKAHGLLIVPTTCGTGSEVTNVAVCAIKRKQAKKGLADDALYAEEAILIPELLAKLPYRFFATSSIDALIHSIEAYLSGSASTLSTVCATEAIRLILRGYKRILKEGTQAWLIDKADYLRASNMGGIAFGNAGTATVHALSYPLSGRYHIPHGEANQLMLNSVLRHYDCIAPIGRLANLKALLAECLDVEQTQALQALDCCLHKVYEKKSLKEYGISSDVFHDLANDVYHEQQRLLKNSYVEMNIEDLEMCYQQCK